MAIKYKLIQRRDFTRGAQPTDRKYYATLVSNGTASLEEICESISEETALTSADVKSCLDRLPRIIARHLREGRNVQVGELGSFRFVLCSSGADTEKEFDAATMMRTPKLVFTPGMVLKDVREKATYTRVTKKPEGEETTEGGEETESPGTV